MRTNGVCRTRPRPRSPSPVTAPRRMRPSTISCHRPNKATKLLKDAAVDDADTWSSGPDIEPLYKHYYDAQGREIMEKARAQRLPCLVSSELQVEGHPDRRQAYSAVDRCQGDNRGRLIRRQRLPGSGAIASGTCRCQMPSCEQSGRSRRRAPSRDGSCRLASDRRPEQPVYPHRGVGARTDVEVEPAWNRLQLRVAPRQTGHQRRAARDRGNSAQLEASHRAHLLADREGNAVYGSPFRLKRISALAPSSHSTRGAAIFIDSRRNLP